MSQRADTAFADAALALELFLIAPRQLGGLVLRGAGPARETLVERLTGALKVKRVPSHVDDDRLLGGIDLAASLAAGRPVPQPGLLDEAAGGAVLVPMAERLAVGIAGRLAQALDTQAQPLGLVLLDDGKSPDETPAASLLERVAFLSEVGEARPAELGRPGGVLAIEDVAPIGEAALTALAETAAAIGVDSVRALLFAQAAARAHAALNARRIPSEADLQVAARLVLAPRATRMPDSADEPPDDSAAQPDDPTTPQDVDLDSSPQPMSERIIEAALAAIPPDLLARLAQGAGRRGAKGSGGGQKAKSKLRGKPLAARPGMPRGGTRLALIDTLRAAVPWQALRRREAGERAPDGMLVRKSDLRVRRFENRAAAVTVFCVDASGSAAMARLAEAKGAVELMLAQAYVTRSEVALIAFRDSAAQLLLPPTRSLTRAQNALASMPGGGGTPLAAGIAAARAVADSVAARGSTPLIVFLTDGSANIAADGSPGRARAREDAEAAARGVASSGHPVLVLDIAPRPRPDAEALARALHARYLPMPMADAAAMRRAVELARVGT
ncbi:MAG: magnesium chelatase subunit D [Pseudomonadota bacterium]|nr:magnesium chelatase subunit D [Pseudomonadota bacterium]